VRINSDGNFAFTVTLVAADPIDTADPFDDEPLLAPGADRSEVECFTGTSSTHHCFECDGQVYADYETSEETTVYVSAQLDGRNERFSDDWTRQRVPRVVPGRTPRSAVGLDTDGRRTRNRKRQPSKLTIQT
jgi:hypothetical protein